MPERMTSEGVAAEQENVGSEEESSDTDAESRHTCRWIGEPHRFPRVVREKYEEQESEVEEVAMDVLNDERKRSLTAVSLSRLSYGAARRV
jgi:hypothetical protein